jgi:hypothetical protein
MAEGKGGGTRDARQLVDVAVEERNRVRGQH